MNRIIMVIIAAGTLTAQANPTLEKRVAELEKEVAALKAALAPVMEKAEAEQITAQQRAEAKKRMRKDTQIYSKPELREIERLYQVANEHWKTEEGKDSLKELVEKYDKANRTGCALLYLGQMSQGEEREEYLKEAIEDFSDCYYGDGVQVGPYARYHLAYHYRRSGKENEAADLFEEIGELYPHAIDHRGALLSALIAN